RIGKQIEQRRLSGIGVADERDRRQARPHPRFALGAARLGKVTKFGLELVDATQQSPPVHLELRLTGTAGTDAAGLLAEGQASASPAASGGMVTPTSTIRSRIARSMRLNSRPLRRRL